MKDGPPPTLVELHDEVAETVIRKEELVLSKADEVCSVFAFRCLGHEANSRTWLWDAGYASQARGLLGITY